MPHPNFPLALPYKSFVDHTRGGSIYGRPNICKSVVLRECAAPLLFLNPGGFTGRVMSRMRPRIADGGVDERCAAPFGLSPRQWATLRQLLAGDSEKEVARALGISQNTAHVYVQGIYRWFDVRSRSELLARFVPRVSDAVLRAMIDKGSLRRAPAAMDVWISSAYRCADHRCVPSTAVPGCRSRAVPGEPPDPQLAALNLPTTSADDPHSACARARRSTLALPHATLSVPECA